MKEERGGDRGRRKEVVNCDDWKSCYTDNKVRKLRIHGRPGIAQGSGLSYPQKREMEKGDRADFYRDSSLY